MRKVLLSAALFLFFCSGSVFADNVSTNTVVQGNQGYVYGSALPPQAPEPVVDNGSHHPLGDIIRAINKLDDWIQRNLW